MYTVGVHTKFALLISSAIALINLKNLTASLTYRAGFSCMYKASFISPKATYLASLLPNLWLKKKKDGPSKI